MMCLYDRSGVRVLALYRVGCVCVQMVMMCLCDRSGVRVLALYRVGCVCVQRVMMCLCDRSGVRVLALYRMGCVCVQRVMMCLCDRSGVGGHVGHSQLTVGRNIVQNSFRPFWSRRTPNHSVLQSTSVTTR